MAVEKKTFTGGLTTDLDAAYLRPNQYLNALNIRVSSTEDGSQGVVSNIKGNTKVTFTMPSGTNTCIGSYSDDENARVFYFIHNSNDDHLILCYFHKEDTIRKVIDNNDFASGQDGLGFSTSNLITGVGMNDDMLFFTDGVTEPKRINVERALKKYDSSYTQLKVVDKYTTIDDALISAIRTSPIYPPFTRKFKDNSKNRNLIRGNKYTFAYRFIYIDGEIGDCSPYSGIVHELNPDDATDYAYNTIELSIPSGQTIPSDVKFVEYLVKFNDEPSFGIFHTERDAFAISAHGQPEVLKANFANDTAKIQIDAAEVTRYKSAVPVTAKALECARGRVFYGNIQEGLDNPTTKEVSDIVELYPEVRGTAVQADYVMFHQLTYNTSSYTPVDDNFFRFVLVQGTTNDGYFDFSGNSNPYDSDEDVRTDWTSDSLNSTRYPSSVTLGTKRGTTEQDVKTYIATQNSQGINNFTITQRYTDDDTSVTVSATANPLTLSDGLKVWKSGSSYRFAMSFSDKFGRVGEVIPFDIPLSIPERDAAWNEIVKDVKLNLDTAKQSSIIPEWAYTFQFLRTKSIDRSFFVSWPAEDVLYIDDIDGTTAATFDEETHKYIQVELMPTLSGVGYTYSEGDILYITGGGVTNEYLNVIQVDGNYVYCEARDIGTFQTTDWAFRTEIFSPVNKQDQEVYYEFGKTYKVNNPTESNRAFEISSFTFSGDTFVKSDDFGTGAQIYFECTSPDLTKFKSWPQLTGRSFLETTFGAVKKPHSISFSERRIDGTKINGLCTINALDEETLPNDMGPIQKLLFTSKTEGSGNTLLALATNETASVYIGESQLSTSTGSTFIAVQQGVIGSTQVLRGSYGTLHPESVVENNNRVYFFDAINGTAVSYDVNGLRPIGDLGLRSFFRDRANAILSQNKKGCFGGFDSKENEYILTLPQVEAEQEYHDDYIDELSNADVLDGNQDAYDGLELNFTGDVRKGRKYRVEIGDQVGLDVSNNNSLFDSITIKYSDDTTIGTTSTTDKGGFIEFVAAQDSSGLKLVIADSEGVTQAGSDEMFIILSEFRPLYYQIENGDAITLAYSEAVQGWTSRYSFVPEFYSSVSTAFISFKSGELWIHDTNSTRNSFYGTSYKSQIATTTRDFPSAVKSFGFIAIEGNIPPSFIHLRTSGKYMDRTSSGEIPSSPTYSDFIQSSDLSDSEFIQKEGHYYAAIFRDRLEPAPSGYNSNTYSTNSLTGEKLINQFLLFMLEFDTTSKIKIRFADIGYTAQRGHNI